MLYICERFILRKGEIVRLSENIRVNSNITEGGINFEEEIFDFLVIIGITFYSVYLYTMVCKIKRAPFKGERR